MDKEADDDSEWFRREVGVEPDPGEAARERLFCAVPCCSQWWYTPCRPVHLWQGHSGEEEEADPAQRQ